jgi:hypothetical protein
MKQLLLLTLFVFELLSATIKTPIISTNEELETLSIKVEKIDVGMSGFVVHTIAPGHTSIIKNVVVTRFDSKSKIATLKMQEFNALKNNSLPTGKWQPKVGDTIELAFGYSRALLIAPSEEIYYRIAKSVNIQWIHPDLFATILSFHGHPTPLKEDFEAMGISSSVGLLFIYLEKKVYTVDMHSFQILSISDAPLTQESVKLPFYSRVEEIEANWFGEGSDELEEYEPHYYELLVEYNKKNRAFYKVIKSGDEKFHYLLEEFDLEENND